MAAYLLIDGYLESLRTSVRWRRDVDDLVEEVRDHLYSAAEHSQAQGAGSEMAQSQTLERFGDPEVLATAFASNPQGGLAVPTRFTKDAGKLALASAATWLAFLVALALSAVLPGSPGAEPDQVTFDGETIAFMAATVALLAAGVLMVVVMIALWQRHGGLGPVGAAGIAIAGFGVAASLISWAFALWLTLLSVGTLLFGVAMLRRDTAPRVWASLFGMGLTVGAIAWHLLRWFEVGSPDQWGNYVAADVTGVYLGVSIMVAGLAGVGVWLSGEEPAQLAPAEPAPAGPVAAN